MKTAAKIIRGTAVAVLCAVLAVNLYFIAARVLLKENNPKFLGCFYSVVLSGSMEPEFYAGDMLFYREQKNYSVYDIVMFTHGGSFVTHRIIEQTKDGFVTKGDNNNTADTDILPPQNIEGKMIFVIPKVGNFLLFLRSPIGIFTLIAAGLILWEIPDIAEFVKRKKGEH